MTRHADHATGWSISPISCMDGGETPVLAIHGSAATGKQWQNLRLRLENERKVVAPDLPGYGDNAAASGAEQPGLAGRAQPLVALLQRHQRPVHVVAHSFGAAIALELVRALPQAEGRLIVTPGVRPAGAALGDQKRVATPASAIGDGADHIVVGRPIYQAQDPKAAAEAVLAELNSLTQH